MAAVVAAAANAARIAYCNLRLFPISCSQTFETVTSYCPTGLRDARPFPKHQVGVMDRLQHANSLLPRRLKSNYSRNGRGEASLGCFERRRTRRKNGLNHRAGGWVCAVAVFAERTRAAPRNGPSANIGRGNRKAAPPNCHTGSAVVFTQRGGCGRKANADGPGSRARHGGAAHSAGPGPRSSDTAALEPATHLPSGRHVPPAGR